MFFFYSVFRRFSSEITTRNGESKEGIFVSGGVFKNGFPESICLLPLFIFLGKDRFSPKHFNTLTGFDSFLSTTEDIFGIIGSESLSADFVTEQVDFFFGSFDKLAYFSFVFIKRIFFILYLLPIRLCRKIGNANTRKGEYCRDSAESRKAGVDEAKISVRDGFSLAFGIIDEFGDTFLAFFQRMDGTF